jgi:hypothetical protein
MKSNQSKLLYQASINSVNQRDKRQRDKRDWIYVVKPQCGETSMEVGLCIPQENSNLTREGIPIWMI